MLMFAVMGLPHYASAQFTSEALIDEPFAYWSMNESGPGAASNLGTDPVENATFPNNEQVVFGAPGLADENLTSVRFNGFDEASGVGGFMNMATRRTPMRRDLG